MPGHFPHFTQSLGLAKQMLGTKSVIIHAIHLSLNKKLMNLDPLRESFSKTVHALWADIAEVIVLQLIHSQFVIYIHTCRTVWVPALVSKCQLDGKVFVSMVFRKLMWVHLVHIEIDMHLAKDHTLKACLLVYECSVEFKPTYHSILFSFYALVPEVYFRVAGEWHHGACTSVVNDDHFAN